MMINLRIAIVGLLIGCCFASNIQAMDVVSLGDLCFRVRDPKQGNNLQRLMRLEVISSGSQNYELKGVIKQTNTNKRIWVSGTSHQLDGQLPEGVSHWFTAQLQGVYDITNEDALSITPYYATFTHPFPLTPSATKYRDSVGYSDVYTIELSSCADFDFQNLYNNEFSK